MQFLYILSLNESFHDIRRWTEENHRTQGEHFNYLKNLYEQGVMKHVGRTDLDLDDEDLHGYAIFEAGNETEAQALMLADPAVRDGLMYAKLLPYRIVFHS